MPNKIKITLDPGHTKNNNPGVSYGYYEGNRMYDLALYMKDELEKKYQIFDVQLTRYSMSANPNTVTRGQDAVKYGSRLFMSLHTNASTYANTNYTMVIGSVKRLSDDNSNFMSYLNKTIAKTLVDIGCDGKYTYTNNSNYRILQNNYAFISDKSKINSSYTDYYSVVRNSVVGDIVQHSFLIENGFHTNDTLCKVLMDDNNLKLLAKNLSKEIYDLMKKYYISDNLTMIEGVTSAAVNVRAEADVTSHKLGTLNTLRDISIIGYSKDKDGDKWYAIDYNGSIAYISAFYSRAKDSDIEIPEFKVSMIEYPSYESDDIIELVNAEKFEEFEPVESAIVDTDVLNVRTGPGTEYGIVTTLKLNDEVEMYNQFDFDIFGDWMPVNIPSQDNTKGYIHGNYIKYNSYDYDTYYINVNALNIRTGPGTSYAVHKVGIKNDIVYAKPSRTEGWSMVIIPNEENMTITSDTPVYYTSSQYLTKISLGVPDEEIVAPVAKVLPVGYAYIKNTTNVYSNPSTASALLGKYTYTYGYAVVLGEENNFYKIIYNGGIGYCQKSLVNVLYPYGMEDSTKLSLLNTKDKAILDIGNSDTKAWFLSTMNCWMSSDYGYRIDPITGAYNSFHNGIDFAAAGGTPIYTPAEGIIIFSGWNAYGNCCIIMTPDANIHYFAHMKYTPNQKAGTFMPVGALVGYVGTTGMSTGNHLHYEIRRAPYIYIDDNFNPMEYQYPNTINTYYDAKTE